MIQQPSLCLLRLLCLCSLFVQIQVSIAFQVVFRSERSLLHYPPQHGYPTTALFAKKKKKKQVGKANHDSKWQPCFEQLVQYCANHGDFEIEGDEDLKIWLDDQRTQYEGMKVGRKVRLTRKRANALESIGAVEVDFE